MGQIAYIANSGEVLEAFSLPDLAWDALSTVPKGTILMPGTSWPAVAKTSIRGLRFFSHYPGYPNPLPEPESYAHTRLKIDVVKALRAEGWKADVEVRGRSPDGAEWIADVLAEDEDGRKFAFEIQLSSQHLDDFLLRTDRYKRSSVSVCWVMSWKPVELRLQKALLYANRDYNRKHERFMCDSPLIMPLRVDLPSKSAYPEVPIGVTIGRGPYLKKLSLGEAVSGVMKGHPRWDEPDWKWGDHVNPKPPTPPEVRT